MDGIKIPESAQKKGLNKLNSKRKGNAAERELVAILKAHGVDAWRNDQRYIGGEENPDVQACGPLAGFHFEVKRTERLDLPGAFRQAERDCGNRIPAVVHRRNREKWKISMYFDDFLILKGVKEWRKTDKL